MNSVQLNRRVIFLVIGYPGAGKTYFSRQFAELINGVHVSDDRIRFELFEEPKYDNNEEQVVERIRDYMLEELIKTDKSIIIDANLNKATRKRLKDSLRATKSPFIPIWVQTDLETSFDRASNRDRRSTDDKYTTNMSFEVFDKQQKAFKRPDREEAIVISGKHLFKTQAASVIRRLNAAKLVFNPGVVGGPIPQQNPNLHMSGRVDPNIRRNPLR